MNTVTHTQAGRTALAGVARLGAVTGVQCLAAPAVHAIPASAAALGGYGHHQSASWTVDALAKPTTFMVFDRKNRPTRQPSELSP
jgi:hypothetical protein